MGSQDREYVRNQAVLPFARGTTSVRFWPKGDREPPVPAIMGFGVSSVGKTDTCLLSQSSGGPASARRERQRFA